jgi:hypothetical protein
MISYRAEHCIPNVFGVAEDGTDKFFGAIG